ncbi:MAG: conjugal transfer protein TraA [Rhodospirillaceae bacterium]|nr:MAG: conjugal transfer protein TraA [Rhodospirillaceae bacterium]
MQTLRVCVRQGSIPAPFFTTDELTTGENMAIYHLSIKTVKRSTGRSAVAAAAYRSASKLVDDRTGQIYDYTRKQGVVFSEIVISKTAPVELSERNALWDSAEAAETRKNSVTAREYEIALPVELDPAQQKACVHDFNLWLVERFSVGVDMSIHAPHKEGDQRNYHAHILTTTREISGKGFGKKTRELDDKKSGAVIEVRSKWAEIANQHLERAQVEERIDHRSHKSRNIEAAPTFHLGVSANAMERRGIKTDRGNKLRIIKAANQALHLAKLAHHVVKNHVQQAAQKTKDILSAVGATLLKRRHEDVISKKRSQGQNRRDGMER